jgi:ParB-like chromosome segregation protein Spo0J
MTKRKASLSPVMTFMSPEAQDQIREQAGVVSSLPLEAILPDPAQPRQLLSSELILAIFADELTPTAALEQWMDQGKREDAPPALKRNVQELRRLADSIARHGLINPISVRRSPQQLAVPAGIRYLIITGERRYWAHVLLTIDGAEIQEGVETYPPDRIKATIAPDGISVRAHQIIENLLREDIDAIEKANGFVALRQELSGQDSSIPTDERNHGSSLKLVEWKQVSEAVGISDRYRRYVLSVLNLSEDAQAIIRANGLTERAIRPVSQKLKEHPDLQVKALQRVVGWQQEGSGDDAPGQPIAAAVDSLADSLLLREQRKQMRASGELTTEPPGPEQLHGRVKSTLKAFEQLGEPELLGLAEALANSDTGSVMVTDLRALERKLNELLRAVEQQRAASGHSEP